MCYKYIVIIACFYIQRTIPEKAEKEKPEEPIPAVNEKPINFTEGDPKNQSGCQIQ